MSESSGAPAFRAAQIDHVELFVPDRHEAAGWYGEVLGLEVVPEYAHWAEDPRGPLMISSDGGGTKLALFTGEPQGERATAGYHLVAFRTDAEGFFAFLRSAGERGISGQDGRPLSTASARDHGKAFSVYFSDPYGHRLEVTTYEHEAVRDRLAGA